MRFQTLLLVALAAAVEVLLLLLADWQYHRMLYKQAMATALEAQPLTTLAGTWDVSRTVAPDNQPDRDGTPGRRILTPLATPSGTVIVERGWLPPPPDGASPPDFTRFTPTAAIVSGILQPFPTRHGWLPSPDTTTDPRVLTFLNPSRITSATVGGMYLSARTPTAPGLKPDAGPPPDADMHASYALQWLVMALVFPLCCLAAWRRKR
jgi:cytochrome oxidase assembly protein ShyY1